MQSVDDAEKRVRYRKEIVDRHGGWENTAYLYAAERDLLAAELRSAEDLIEDLNYEALDRS